MDDTAKGAAAALTRYAKNWLTRVGAELQSKLSEAIRAVDHRVDHEWELTVRGMAAEGEAWTVTAKNVAFDAEAGAAARPGAVTLPKQYSDPSEDSYGLRPMTALLAPEQGLVFVVVAESGELKKGYLVRTFAARTLHPAKLPVQSAAIDKPIRFGCAEVGSVSSAVYRAEALCNLGELNPLLAGVVVPGLGNWLRDHNWDQAQPWSRGSLAPAKIALNPGQQRALDGLAGSVTVVQGPPGTGKSSYIAEVFNQRVPPSAKVLCTLRYVGTKNTPPPSVWQTGRVCIGCV